MNLFTTGWGQQASPSMPISAQQLSDASQGHLATYKPTVSSLPITHMVGHTQETQYMAWRKHKDHMRRISARLEEEKEIGHLSDEKSANPPLFIGPIDHLV
ncbi:hypothetical protein HOH87_01255 [bacterium]|nr:hypothetical protein [bacterium]